MSHTHLATYLNDHLAGSLVGIQLLENMASAYAGTDFADFANILHEEVVQDRMELEGIMARLNIGQSLTRKTAGWLSEKLAQLKLRIDDPASGAFRLLETVEAVSLGVEGKRLLWLMLQAQAERLQQLSGQDFDRLIARAQDQRERLETIRINAGALALA